MQLLGLLDYLWLPVCILRVLPCSFFFCENQSRWESNRSVDPIQSTRGRESYLSRSSVTFLVWQVREKWSSLKRSLWKDTWVSGCARYLGREISPHFEGVGSNAPVTPTFHRCLQERESWRRPMNFHEFFWSSVHFLQGDFLILKYNWIDAKNSSHNFQTSRTGL